MWTILESTLIEEMQQNKMIIQDSLHDNGQVYELHSGFGKIKSRLKYNVLITVRNDNKNSVPVLGRITLVSDFKR